MRKVFIACLLIVALFSLLFVQRATEASPAAITQTAASYMPYVVKQETPTPTATSTPRPTPTMFGTPRPYEHIAISELSGHSNPEYVDVVNFGAAPQDMTGWYIVSTIGQERFNFPDGFILNGYSGLVQIESGGAAINNPPLQLLWTNQMVWSNSGDKAILYSRSGEVVSTACYGIGCAPATPGP